jgi:hypothetical protein
MFCPKCGAENPDTGRFCRGCGTDLSGVSKALNKKSSDDEDIWGGDWWGDSSGFGDSTGKKDPEKSEDVFSGGVGSIFMGIGFAIASIVLFTTGVAGGKSWWWALLIPAFIFLANGFTEIAKAKRLEKKEAKANPLMQDQIASTTTKLNLPPTQADYVKPQVSIYETDDLVAPPSVTEQTTKHLEINQEGETMTLPKK